MEFIECRFHTPFFLVVKFSCCFILLSGLNYITVKIVNILLQITTKNYRVGLLQRVPVTEKSGRVHTSAVSVAILPQADEVVSSL